MFRQWRNMPSSIKVLSRLHVYTRVAWTHSHGPACQQCQTQSFHPSIYHPSFNLLCPLLSNLSRTHPVAAVGFHLIPQSSHVITALNPGPSEREGVRPHCVFTDCSIWTCRRHSRGVLFGVKDTLEDQKKKKKKSRHISLVKDNILCKRGWVHEPS